MADREAVEFASSYDEANIPAENPSTSTFIGKLNQTAVNVSRAFDRAYKNVATKGSQFAEYIRPSLETFATETAELGETVSNVGAIVGVYRPDIGAKLSVLGGAMERVDDRFEKGADKTELDLLRYETDPGILYDHENHAGMRDTKDAITNLRLPKGNKRKTKPGNSPYSKDKVGKVDDHGPAFNRRN